VAQPELHSDGVFHSSHGVQMVVLVLVGDASSYAIFDGQNGDPRVLQIVWVIWGIKKSALFQLCFFVFFKTETLSTYILILSYIWYKDNTKETIGRCMNLANG